MDDPHTSPRSKLVYSSDREGMVRVLLAQGEDPRKLVQYLTVGRTLEDVLRIVSWCAPLLGMSDAEFMRIARRRRGRGVARG